MASRRKMERAYERAMELEFKGRPGFFERQRLKRERLLEALELAEELGDLPFQGGVLRELTTLVWPQPDWQEIAGLLDEDVELAIVAEDAEWELHSRLLRALKAGPHNIRVEMAGRRRPSILTITSSLAAEPGNSAVTHAEDRPAVLEHLEQALDISVDAEQEEWRLAAAALTVSVAKGTRAARETRAAFAEALEGIELEAWSRLDDAHARVARQLAARPAGHGAAAVVSALGIESGYGDFEAQGGGIVYVHHRSFRQRLRLEPRAPAAV